MMHQLDDTHDGGAVSLGEYFFLLQQILHVIDIAQVLVGDAGQHSSEVIDSLREAMKPRKVVTGQGRLD